MTTILGYLGLTLNLTSMAMKDIFHLRLLSLLANAIYIVYGFLIGATPFVIGCTIAVLIHSHKIYIIKQRTKNDFANSKQ